MNCTLIKSSWINFILHSVRVVHYDFISLGKRIQPSNPKILVVVEPLFLLKPHQLTLASKLE